MNTWLKAAAVAVGVYYFVKKRKSASSNEENGGNDMGNLPELKINVDVSLSSNQGDKGTDKQLDAVITFDNTAEKDTGVAAVLGDMKLLAQPASLYDAAPFKDRFITVEIPSVIVPGGESVEEKVKHNYYGAMFNGVQSTGKWALRFIYTLCGETFADDLIIDMQKDAQ